MTRPVTAFDAQGNPLFTTANPGMVSPVSGSTLASVAQDGTDSTDANATQATGGVGIRGWLSTLVSLFRSGSAKVTTTVGTASGAAVTSVASSASSVTLKASNAGRKGLSVFNDSTANLYIAYAPTASTTTYTVKVPPGIFWEMDLPVYDGLVSGIWDSVNGSARVTEKS